MPRELEHNPSIIHPKSILKGFASGSLIVFSLVSGDNPLVQFILFIAGLVILLDSIIFRGEDIYIITSLVSCIFGFIITFVMSLTPYLTQYITLVIILIALLYSRSILKHALFLKARMKK
ncbi:MAG: hypothetical protein DRP15_00850 [Candidatus Aenigmatarchaeota archaeon]|nr:MAG: hypothetical protein DRP15_00850 [Candidatus Aenigmarchaeota archaeon]